MEHSALPVKEMPTGMRPAPLACLVCRHKHQKCDGQQPICGRCLATGTQAQCQYMPSRRGYKGPSKRRRANSQSPDEYSVDISSLDSQPGGVIIDFQNWTPQQGRLPYAPTAATTAVPAAAPVTISPAASTSPWSNTGRPEPLALAPQPASGPLTPESTSPLSGDGYLVDLYYTSFHTAHPILPPQRFLYRSFVPAFLEQVIKFIGAHFTPATSSEIYRSSVRDAVIGQDPSIEKLQALLLLAIVLHSRNERVNASDCLNRAVDLAFELGLYRPDFAVMMGDGDPIREESIRRTWWELFVVEGLLTALGVRDTFRTNSIPLDVPLPCEEQIFQDGLEPPPPPPPPPPPTIAQFENRIFADEEYDFSSYTYRIEAVRILGRVVTVTRMSEGQSDEVEAIDARIASWFHHLPESKAEMIKPDGSVDEMMFQATMVVHGASIYLNFPRSDLLSSPAVATEVICGHPGPCSVPAFSHHQHAIKAVKAASELSNLASLRMPVVKHTPFFICSLVLSSIVQLAACSVKAGQIPDPCRDRLMLTIGVFKSLGNTWAISQSIMRQIKAVARDVMDLGLRPTIDQFDIASVLDGGQYWLQDGLPNVTG